MREELRDAYSEAGRPSIDPEVLLRILLLGYMYGITSERKLLEELRMHLAWRWFTGLGFDQEIPHHSTFSKNRHGHFQPSRVFQEMFERIVEQSMAVGLVQGEQTSVDGSFIQANAAHHTRIPREQLAEAATASVRRLGSPIFRSKGMTAGMKGTLTTPVSKPMSRSSHDCMTSAGSIESESALARKYQPVNVLATG